MKQTPPPSYQDVMDEQPPPYANVEVVREGDCAEALGAEVNMFTKRLVVKLWSLTILITFIITVTNFITFLHQ